MRRLRRPIGPVEIDGNHPLARGLVFLALAGGSDRQDVVTRTVGTVFGAASMGAAVSRGSAMNTPDFVSGMWWPAPKRLQEATDKLTLAVWADITAVAADFNTLIGIPFRDTGWTEPWFSAVLGRKSNTDDGRFGWSTASTLTDILTTTGGYYLDTDPFSLYAATRDGTTVRFYRNVQHGGDATSATGNINFSVSPAVVLLNKSHLSIGEGGQAICDYGAVWTRALTSDEIAWLHEAPYDVLRPWVRRTYVKRAGPPAAAGDIVFNMQIG